MLQKQGKIMLKKIEALGKKYWYIGMIVAFIIGVGSLGGAKSRIETVAKDPLNAVTK